MDNKAEAQTESTEDALRRISEQLETTRKQLHRQEDMWSELRADTTRAMTTVMEMLGDAVADRNPAMVQQTALQISCLAGMLGAMTQIEKTYSHKER